METTIIFENKTVNVILTQVNNIDWVDKTVINSEGIDELNYLSETTIKIFDIIKRVSVDIKVSKLNQDKHQVIIDGKLYVVLHII